MPEKTGIEEDGRLGDLYSQDELSVDRPDLLALALKTLLFTHQAAPGRETYVELKLTPLIQEELTKRDVELMLLDGAFRVYLRAAK